MLVAFGVAAVLAAPVTANAQFVSTQRSVGGVWIDTDGALSSSQIDQTNKLRELMNKALGQAPGDLAKFNPLRKISLRQLEAALLEHQQSDTPMPIEMRYLAGLQRVQYVFVYPDQHDVVLAGPGEGWKIDAQGEVVGLTTGRPVLMLDDLLVALRTADSARQTGISCSIDPTDEGMVRLRQHVDKLTTIGNNPSATAQEIAEVLGPQIITVTGIPTDSHFARVLVAADYKMKRIAMDFEPSPVRGMPSFLAMIKTGSKGMQNMLPRWWLASDYDGVVSDADGLAWELRGQGVKTMTEEDFVTSTGARERTGKAEPMAKKWADTMTAKYEELSQKEAVFGQLRNCMDLAVIAALIVKERLPEKAGYEMTALLDSSRLKTEQFNTPKRVDSKASLMKKGRNWVITASGGVQIESWSALEKVSRDDSLSSTRDQVAAEPKHWWWN
jgi:hypothetical protein